MTDDDYDGETEPAPMDTEARWIAIVFFLLLLGLFTAEIIVNYEPVKLSALFILLFWIPLLALHEAGHAVVAALVGWRVHRVVIGMGRTFTTFRVGRTPVEIRIFPVEGFVLPAPTNLRSPRLKSALIYFAGPGAELLVLAVLAAVLGVDTLLTRTQHVGLLAAQSLAVAILVSAFINLVPHYAVGGPGQTFQNKTANDGLGIILSFTRPLADFARQMDVSAADPWSRDEDWWKG